MSHGHAVLGPSSSSRWMNCTASPDFIESLNLPEDEGSFPSREGTHCHSVMELLVLNNFKVRGGDVFLRHEQVAEEVNGGAELYDTAQMIEDMEPLMDHLRVLDISYPDLEIYVEEKVTLEPITTDVWGTADLILYSRAGDFVQVIDLKYGRVYVEEVANPQLTLYFIGALLSTLRNRVKGFPARAQFVIFQPRAGGEKLREWNVSKDYISDFVDNKLTPCLSGTDVFKTGDWCEYCPGLLSCKEAKGEMMKVAETAFESLDDGAAVKDILDARKMVLALIKAAEERAVQRLTLGKPIEGWKLVEGKTNRKWNASDDDIIDFLRNKAKLKLKDVVVKKIIGIGAAEKMVKASKHVDIKELQDYIIKPVGGPSLAPESDKRPAITAKPFTDITEGTANE